MSLYLHGRIRPICCVMVALGFASIGSASDPGEAADQALVSLAVRIPEPADVSMLDTDIAELTTVPHASCGPCCDVVCSCCCCSQCTDFFRVTAGVAFLNRSDPTSVTLITDQLTGDEVLNTGQFDFDYRAAPWLELTRQYCNCWGWGARFIGLDSWQDMQEQGGQMSPVLQLPQGIPVPTTGPGDILATSYGTDFYSFDINVRHRTHDYFTLLAGFRWVELGELLAIRQAQPIARDLFAVATDNRLYGFQLGTDVCLLDRSKFRVAGTARAGVFYNRAEQSTQAPVLNGIPGVVDGISAQDDHTAFVGEVGVAGQYFLSSRVSMVAGYRLYWLEGLALAANQLRAMDLNAPGTASLDSGGSLFLDGVTLGVNVTF